MSAAVDPFDLDRKVQRAVEAWARPDDGESPLEQHRAVSGVRTLDALVALEPNAVEAPLRDALRVWVTFLLVERLAFGSKKTLEAALSQVSVVAPSMDERVSWRDAWRELLAASDARAAEWLARIADDGRRVASAVREARERTKEVLSRVEEKIAGPGHPGERWQKLALPAPEATTIALADALLAATDDVAAELVREERRRGSIVESGTSTLLSALARDAASAFPAKPRTRWFHELFGAHLHGLRIAASVPARVVGAASFARALASFGHALRLAVSASELPFSLRMSPAALDAERFAVLFGSLVGDRAFLRSMLGATPSEAERVQRALARTMLLTTRVRASQLLLARDERRFEELTTRVFGAPWPPSLAGAWPLLRRGDEARLAAIVESRPLAREVVDRFDADWFRNPRAFEWIRARGAGPMGRYDVATHLIDEGAEPCARAVAAEVEAALG